jgi:mannitol/fructose-specific phosphotransferase system IIA component (Ntr-type)
MILWATTRGAAGGHRVDPGGDVDELLEGLGYPVVEVPPAAARTRGDAIAFLARSLADSGRLRKADTDTLVGRLVAREEAGATVLGRGLALPHLMTEAVDTVTGLVGRAAAGIPWPGGFDESPVRYVILLLTPASRPLETLLAEEAVIRHLFRSAHAREQAVRLRAYRYWDAAGRPPAGAEHFWYQAERDLLLDR